MSDFPIIVAVRVLNTKNISINLNQNNEMKDIDKLFSFYGNNKINFFQGERNEAVFIKWTTEVSESQAAEYLKLISKKKAYEEG